VRVWSSETGYLIAGLAVACVGAAALGAGLVRVRRLHRAALAERGWLLERERESAAAAAVDAERARIARELHDIVSHNVSLMVVQAGAAREVLALMPEQAETAMLAVETAGRGALTELRHLLGLLAPSPDGKDDEDGATGSAGTAGTGHAPESDLSPQPSLRRLSALIDKMSFAGLQVEVRILGEPRPLPAGIDTTAYRIVQEALTNALKHGDRAKAEVTVRYTDHQLRVEVLNTGPSPLSGEGSAPARSAARNRPDGAGRGLLGLHERVAVYGGDLHASRRLGGGYRVRARLPLDRP
jgi:signal transduction histidine kinase